MDKLNEIEQAHVHLLQRTLDDQVEARLLVAPDGEPYSALVDLESNEVLALLCIPPRTLSRPRVVN